MSSLSGHRGLLLGLLLALLVSPKSTQSKHPEDVKIKDLVPVAVPVVAIGSSSPSVVYPREVALLSSRLNLSSLTGSKAGQCLNRHITLQLQKHGFVEFHSIPEDFRAVMKSHKNNNTADKSLNKNMWLCAKFYRQAGDVVYMDVKRKADQTVTTVEIKLPVIWSICPKYYRLEIEQKYVVSLEMDLTNISAWSMRYSGNISGDV
eukprot:GHVS01105316.1.p1 GENE.GHVS01105316.1~~GHVS01105316.1.p1  ORF type:complete len:205 (+),score=24.17 GHVS01105316.1:333-947(+)